MPATVSLFHVLVFAHEEWTYVMIVRNITEATEGALMGGVLSGC